MWTAWAIDSLLGQPERGGQPLANSDSWLAGLTEDQDLFVREGDMVRYGNQYYQIVTVGEPTQIFGQIEHKMEVSAKCIKVRGGVFDAE